MIDTSAKDIEKLRASLQGQYPFINFSKFQSMRMIVDSVGGDWQGLQDYALAKLDKEINEKNRELKEDGTPKYKYVKPTFSEEDDDKVIASGVISQQQYIRIANKWQNYIPMAHVFDENENYDEMDSFKPKTGSDRDIYSPIQKSSAKFFRKSISLRPMTVPLSDSTKTASANICRRLHSQQVRDQKFDNDFPRRLAQGLARCPAEKSALPRPGCERRPAKRVRFGVLVIRHALKQLHASR